MKGEAALTALQYIVRSGIERIELRDEILCQLLRQTNDNLDVDCLRQAWVVLCLCTASFSPSKNLHKVRPSLYACNEIVVNFEEEKKKEVLERKKNPLNKS